MKRTHSTLATTACHVIDWVLRYWFRIIMASCALSVAYDAHVFASRFIIFTSYVYEQMEKRNEITVTPVEPGTVD